MSTLIIVLIVLMIIGAGGSWQAGWGPGPTGGIGGVVVLLIVLYLLGVI